MLTKRYLKTRPAVKVTFQVDHASKARLVELAGDFTNWQPVPMKKLRNGAYKLTVELKPQRDYCFRYRIDGKYWDNDWQADRYEPNGLGDDNSVVIC